MDDAVRVLDELAKANIKAVFFMIGHHVRKYPDIARRVAEEGHEIAQTFVYAGLEEGSWPSKEYIQEARSIVR